jgi:hypothetical protein
MNASSAACCWGERASTRRTKLSPVAGTASPWSNSDRALGGTLPRKTVRDDSSMGPLMRGATEDWAPDVAGQRLDNPKTKAREKPGATRRGSMAFIAPFLVKRTLMVTDGGFPDPDYRRNVPAPILRFRRHLQHTSCMTEGRKPWRCSNG